MKGMKALQIKTPSEEPFLKILPNKLLSYRDLTDKIYLWKSGWKTLILNQNDIKMVI